MSAIEKRRRQRRIPRCALLHPDITPWRKLFLSQDDSAMITLTGFDYQSFTSLLLLVRDDLENNSPHSADGCIIQHRQGKGRNRIMTAEDCLALTLAWTRTRVGR